MRAPTSGMSSVKYLLLLTRASCDRKALLVWGSVTYVWNAVHVLILSSKPIMIMTRYGLPSHNDVANVSDPRDAPHCCGTAHAETMEIGLYDVELCGLTSTRPLTLPCCGWWRELAQHETEAISHHVPVAAPAMYFDVICHRKCPATARIVLQWALRLHLPPSTMPPPARARPSSHFAVFCFQ